MRPRMLGLFFAMSFGTLAPSAYAQDDDFTFEEEGDDPFFDGELPEEPDEAPPADAPPADAPPADAPPATPAKEEDLLGDEGLDFEDETDETGETVEEDLFGAERDTRSEVLAPGTDNVRIYRDQQKAFAELPADEEVMAWEAYLAEYPASIFRERIMARMDELQDAQYKDRIIRDEERSGKDPAQAEILLAQPLHMPSINPRTRVGLGLDLGFGAGTLYTGGRANFEYALLRNLSIGAGLGGGYNGWGLEFGAHYAPVKSAKDKLIFTILADFKLNFAPFFFQIRPQLALAKVVGPAQIMLSVGTEIGTRPGESVAILGGAHVHVRVAEAVAVFAETEIYARNLSREGGAFLFENVTVGLRFYPKMKKRQDDPIQIDAGGTAAVASQYLQYYLGAVGLQGQYFIPAKYVGKRNK